MRHRGLRWLQRHGHLDSAAVHTLDAPDHAGGWSVTASVTIPAWDHGGLERLVRYCARPPLSQERLDRLSKLVTPPRVHKHRYCGVLAPNAKLRRAVIERILGHIGEPTEAPVVLPARSPPQQELEFDQSGSGGLWPEMDQTASSENGFWD